ncbi:phytanoyl-CoA dioxygenase family protein [Rhizobium leguminosarum]|uniref:phytanoyl-CoA dioxygenase family protein n=1 Tax=Rhizobium leguminosarum TaxID=384 RepID=UPI0013E3949A|nr:phytanoyl-CoA dioxygenase family protein [Rhizobium leguminosarum]
MKEEGWCLITREEIGSRELVRRALRSVNLWCADVRLPALSRGLPRVRLRDFASDTFCPDLRFAPEFQDLVEKTGVRSIINSIIGETAEFGVQIALRFPDERGSQSDFHPHIDGFASDDLLDNFNILAGIYLSDVTRQFAGNFTVWPKSHIAAAKFFARHDAQQLLQTKQFSLLREMVIGIPETEPLQVEARAGDVVLCHYLLFHCPAVNLSEDIRYMAFVRFRSTRQARGDAEQLGSLWHYWNDQAMHGRPNDNSKLS